MRILAGMLCLMAVASAQDAVLNLDTLAAWQRFLEPSADERPDEDIAWASSLADGLKEAHRQNKPLLLWMMNGHPLGCT